MKTIHFNQEQIKAEYIERISKIADELIEEYYNEVVFQLKTKEGKDDVKTLSITEKNIIRRKIIGGAYAIVDSFGTGSEMDLINPIIDMYMESDSYNQLRDLHGGAITGWGYESGDRHNVFGEPIISTGKNKGKNLEKVTDENGKHLFEPIKPSYAFQQAFNWILRADRIGKKINITTLLFVSEIRNNVKKYTSFY